MAGRIAVAFLLPLFTVMPLIALWHDRSRPVVQAVASRIALCGGFAVAVVVAAWSETTTGVILALACLAGMVNGAPPSAGGPGNAAGPPPTEAPAFRSGLQIPARCCGICRPER